MARIILDASFIISCANAKVDIQTELKRILGKYEAAMPLIVFDEVKNNGNKICMKILEAIKPTLLTTNSTYGDDAILETTREIDIVATIDKELKKRLKEKGIRVITLRQKKYLEEE